MKNIILALLLPLALVVSGCASVPPTHTTRSGFSEPPKENNGRILITFFHIPKDEPGTTLFRLFAGDTQGNSTPDVYDVTNDIKYIGAIKDGLYGQYRDNQWLEYYAPSGNRTLMLKSYNGPLISHTDFIEVRVEPGKTNYVAISRYGAMRFPYFGEIQMNEKHHEFCSTLKGTHNEKSIEFIPAYMKANGINPYANDFAHFCLALSDNVNVRFPNEVGLEEFNKNKVAIEKERTAVYEKWKRESEQRAPYDLMKDHTPPKSMKPDLPGQ